MCIASGGHKPYGDMFLLHMYAIKCVLEKIQSPIMSFESITVSISVHSIPLRQ
jgi:hypothetical protein